MNAAAATSPTLERRRERRVPVQLPILVRGTDHAGQKFEERTSSVNLCRGGAAFATRYVLGLGDRLQINIPIAPSAGDPTRNSRRRDALFTLFPGQTSAN